MSAPDFDAWLDAGMTAGFIGPPVCVMHDGLPTTAEEDADTEQGGDPCVHILRLYATDEDKLAVETNHSPTVWRASNRKAAL